MSGSDIVIDAQNLHKRFCRRYKLSVRYAIRDMVREAVTGQQPTENLRNGEFWAVQDVSFKLRKGESLGLIGANGCGKTTLLKIVSGIFKPNRGYVQSSPRLMALFARGLGFDPVLSGRENMLINLSMFGLNQQEIKNSIDSVIDFAELPPDSLDAPIKSYSSGMAARLSFSCAIHTKPEILIIDEALAVGDFRFRNKCYRRLTEMRNNGTSFVMVSHSINAIIANCDMALYMAEGKTVSYGPAKQVTSLYEEHLLSGENPFQPLTLNSKVESAKGVFTSNVRIQNITFLDSEKRVIETLKSGQQATLRLTVESLTTLDNINACFIFRDISGELGLVQNIDSSKDQESFNLKSGLNYIDLKLTPCSLRPGLYTLKFYLTSGKGMNVLDAVESYRFKVSSGKEMANCLFYQPREWAVSAVTDPSL